MNETVIRQVANARERRTFLTFPWRIYRGDPLWVPPLLPEREKVIDPDLAAPPMQRLARLAERVRSRGRYRVRGADLAHWDEEADRILVMLNRCLAHLFGFVPWERAALDALLAAFKQIADPELILFAETAGGDAVGWFPGIPNLNEAFIHAGGLRYPWQYAPLLWHMRRPRACIAIKSVLVLPEHWDTGVAVLLFDEMARRATARGYRWADLSLTSDDNPRTPELAAHLGCRIYKRYRVYRKWLAA